MSLARFGGGLPMQSLVAGTGRSINRGFQYPYTFYFAGLPNGSIPRFLTGTTYSISSGKLINTPGVGANLVANGNFAAWTLNNPDTWVTTESTPTTEVSQVGTGQAHGGTGTGMCNIYQGAQIRESVLTSNAYHRASMLVDTLTTGEVQITLGQVGKYWPFNTVGTRVVAGRSFGANANRLQVHRYQGATDDLDVTIDDVTAQVITTANLFCVWNPPAAWLDSDCIIEVDLAHPASDKIGLGVFFGLDSTTTPANYVTFMVWPNPHPLAWGEKNVAGTYTTLVEKERDNPNKVKVEKIGRKFYFYVNDVLIDEPAIVTDSLVVNNKHGLISMDALGGITKAKFSLPTDGYGVGLSVDTPVPYQVHQRNASDQADIAIAGTLKLTGTYTIEASFNGGDWADIATDVVGPNVFSGTLSAQAEGQGNLYVRVKNTSYITQVASVGIGEIFAIAGQSNASGRGTNNQSYSHATLRASMYGNNYRWENLTDPTDAFARGQPDTISQDDTVGGSIYPLIATSLMTDLGVPVAFVPCAMSGTSITQWLAGADHLNRGTLYGSMNYRRTKVGSFRCVLFWQGEKDVYDGMAEATYNGHLDTFANAVAADFSCKVMPFKLQHCTSTSSYPEAAQTAINNAIGTAWADNANVLTGPDLSGIDTDGGSGVHILTDAGLAAVAALTVSALKTAFSWT